MDFLEYNEMSELLSNINVFTKKKIINKIERNREIVFSTKLSKIVPFGFAFLGAKRKLTYCVQKNK